MKCEFCKFGEETMNIPGLKHRKMFESGKNAANQKRKKKALDFSGPKSLTVCIHTTWLTCYQSVHEMEHPCVYTTL